MAMITILEKSTAYSMITVSLVDYHTHKTMIHSIRNAVFVDEQAIPTEIERDNEDLISQHVLACYEGRVVGTGRLTPQGRIGRVAVCRPSRRRGIGLSVMEKLLEVARQNRHREVVLSSQYHAVKFYEKLGFQQEGNVFMKMGIVHIMMRKKLHDMGLPDVRY